MKFIRQPDIVKEISSMTLSTNKRMLAVCERHRQDNSTYITMYDVKNVFKQGASFKEKMRINVIDLFPPGLFTGGVTGAGKDSSALHTNANSFVGGGGAHKHVLSLRFSQDSKYLGILVSSDPNGNSDVKALIFSWIEPSGKDSKHHQ
jgi:hypothetical protein